MGDRWYSPHLSSFFGVETLAGNCSIFTIQNWLFSGKVLDVAKIILRLE